MNIGAKIKQIRIEKGLTQDDLAEATGITKTAISRYELGQRQPSVNQLNAIADALEVWVFDLVNLSPEKQVEMRQSTNTLARVMEKLIQRDELPAEYVEMLEFLRSRMEEELATTLAIASVADQAQNRIKQMERMEQQRQQLGKAQKERIGREKEFLCIFRSLSDAGQEKALEWIRDFGKIPDYQRNRKRKNERAE